MKALIVMMTVTDNENSNVIPETRSNIIEAALEQINIVPVNRDYLELIDQSLINHFKVHVIQTSTKATLADLKADIAKICNETENNSWFKSSNSDSRPKISDKNIRLWRLDPAMNLNDWFHEVQEICRAGYRYTSNYNIEFKGNFLGKDKSLRIEEAQIAKEDYIFVEARENENDWDFCGDGAPILAKCGFCDIIGDSIQCDCKNAAYCSEKCKARDKKYHDAVCELGKSISGSDILKLFHPYKG